MFYVVAAAAFAAQLFAKEPMATAQARDPLADKKLGEAIVVGNLTVYPVYATGRTPKMDYTTLDEAQAAKEITVSEISEGGSVNQVKVRYVGKKPLFLLGGELILGGKQDRIIAFNMILQPTAADQLVACYCVEHGRWQSRAADRVQGQTVSGVSFAAGGAAVSKNVRAKAQAANPSAQTEVWDEVAKKSVETRATLRAVATPAAADTYSREAATGTYRANLTNVEVAQKVGKTQMQIDAKLKGDRLVGFVAGINGEVSGVEIAGSPELFAKVKDKLLKAYVFDAVSQPQPKNEALLEKKVREFGRGVANGKIAAQTNASGKYYENGCVTWAAGDRKEKAGFISRDKSNNETAFESY